MLTCDAFVLMQLKEHKFLYEGYVPMKYKHYYKKMKKYDFSSTNFAASIKTRPEPNLYSCDVCFL
jgi:Cft2 family RNA processing exonuclease